jgi:hypothetical protein
MGFRTASEIDHERYGLKVLRGDFAQMATADGYKKDVHRVLDAVKQ